MTLSAPGSDRRSLAQRAVMAVALMVGFYAIALSLAFGLLAIPFIEYRLTGGLHAIQLQIGLVLTALAILAAIWPRRDRFTPPGPEIEAHEAPELFALLRGVASAAGQEMPAHVYLDGQVNAAVTHRGGVMGYGSRRVMILGLPLIQGLSSDELRAVVAHEFGHYRAGDVSLGPWVYKTRSTIARAVSQLGEGFVGKVFSMYGALFLRITAEVSREQEFVADEVSASVTTPDTAARTLTRVERVASITGSYWYTEVVPVLNAGFLPPLGTGFALFLASESVQTFLTQPRETGDERHVPGDYDTHPPIAARLAALARLTAGTTPAPAPTVSAALVPQVDEWATRAFVVSVGREAVEKLKPIAWTDVAGAVIAPAWLESRTQNARWLSAFVADEAPAGRAAFLAASAGLGPAEKDGVTDEMRIERAAHVWALGVAAALIDDGWTIDTAPGLPALLVRDTQRINPFATARQIIEGRTTAGEWREQCRDLGLSGRRLGTAPDASPAGA